MLALVRALSHLARRLPVVVIVATVVLTAVLGAFAGMQEPAGRSPGPPSPPWPASSSW